MLDINNNGGNVVSRAGDINGDGIDDMVIAGSDLNYVVFGKEGEWSSSLDLSSLDGSISLGVNGGTPYILRSEGYGYYEKEGVSCFLNTHIPHPFDEYCSEEKYVDFILEPLYDIY